MCNVCSGVTVVRIIFACISIGSNESKRGKVSPDSKLSDSTTGVYILPVKNEWKQNAIDFPFD